MTCITCFSYCHFYFYFCSTFWVNTIIKQRIKTQVFHLYSLFNRITEVIIFTPFNVGNWLVLFQNQLEFLWHMEVCLMPDSSLWQPINSFTPPSCSLKVFIPLFVAVSKSLCCIIWCYGSPLDKVSNTNCKTILLTWG